MGLVLGTGKGSKMKITELRVFELEGVSREGVALYEIDRGGLKPNEVSPYRQILQRL